MFRTLFSILFFALAVSAFSPTAFVSKRSDVLASSKLASLNTLGDVKENFSGPNMMVGSADDKMPMMPPVVAPRISSETAGGLSVADFTDKKSDMVPAAAAAATGAGRPVATRRRKWVTAVFWSELNLYGHVLTRTVS